MTALTEARKLLAWAQEDPENRAGEAAVKVDALDGDDPELLGIAESLATMADGVEFLGGSGD